MRIYARTPLDLEACRELFGDPGTHNVQKEDSIHIGKIT